MINYLDCQKSMTGPKGMEVEANRWGMYQNPHSILLLSSVIIVYMKMTRFEIYVSQ